MSQSIYLSIIIPTLNEASNIGQLLKTLPYHRTDIEIIVVDGGSDDGTRDITQRFDIPCFTCPPSRGRQLQLGVQQARGDVFWFLHADSHVDSRHVDVIIETLKANTQIIGGNFAITFSDNDPFSLWLNRFYSHIRDRGFYYGDSGIFIRRHILNELGGIPAKDLMEDYALVRRMQKHSLPTTCINHPHIVSSSRRFQGRSRKSIIVGWIMIHITFYLHLPDSWLAYFYDSKRKRSKAYPNLEK